MTNDSFTAQVTGEENTDLAKLLDRNRIFADRFDKGNLTIRPRMSTILLTCVDSRVDPAHLMGLGLGDAVVMRNAAAPPRP